MEENNNNSNNNNNNNKGEKHVPNHSTIIKEDLHHHQESSRKVIGGSGERVKRDEWSEGAVSTLLEAYESKWVLRNRAKLKGHDWEDVAKHVSARGNSTKSPKTQTQCKNKIESMKKRYRSESASATTADASSWPLYSRLDLLLRGTGPVSSLPPLPTTVTPITVQSPSPHAITTTATSNQAFLLLEPPSVAVSKAHLQQPPTSFVAPLPIAQNSHGSNGVERLLAKEDGLGGKSCEHVSNKNPMDSDSSTPALYSEKDKVRCNKRKMKSSESNKRRRRNSSSNNNNNSNEEMEIVESIRWLGEVMVRSEQTRMDTMKEIEKMRVEAEAKRGEMELKRTEIIANTQLEIARIFSSINKDVDSSLRIGRS